jgi:hypothetical protein
MKRNIVFCCYFLIFSGVLFTQNTTPSWYLDTELEYPRNRFIAAVGEGKTRTDAETAAIAAISLFFSTQTDVRNEIIREFNEAVTNNTTDFSRKTYITENAIVSSEQEFLGVRFAAPFFIQKQQTWAALAYIDRAEASRTYESKISVNMASINNLAADASQESEPLYSCGLLFRAIKIAGITEEYIKTAIVIDPSSAAKYSTYINQIQNIRSRYRSNRDRLTFTVNTNSTDSTGRIERKLQELLEANGCIVSARNPQYTVSIRLNMSEENTDAGIFIRSGITVRVEGKDRALLSYSKNYQRYGHATQSGAYNRAFMAIEQDMEANFTTQLTALIGR